MVSGECGGDKLDHEFTKMRNIKREMDLMDNLCGQFNELTTIQNRMIVNSDLELSVGHIYRIKKKNLRIRYLIYSIRH